jgi:hypothetical protein
MSPGKANQTRFYRAPRSYCASAYRADSKRIGYRLLASALRADLAQSGTSSHKRACEAPDVAIDKAMVAPSDGANPVRTTALARRSSDAPPNNKVVAPIVGFVSCCYLS